MVEKMKKLIKEKTISDKVKDVWKVLNSLGVYTYEDFEKFSEKYKLDIGMFTSPLEEVRSE